MPAINGSANSLMEDTPNTSSAATMKKVVSEVKILLESVWEILLLTSSCSSSLLRISRIFSRILSKITMVALME